MLSGDRLVGVAGVASRRSFLKKAGAVFAAGVGLALLPSAAEAAPLHCCKVSGGNCGPDGCGSGKSCYYCQEAHGSGCGNFHICLTTRASNCFGLAC